MKLEKRASSEIAQTLESVKRYAQNAKAENTRRAYKSDWNDFVLYCDTHGFSPAPATSETIALYLSNLADNGIKYSTLKRRIATIGKMHKLNNMESPINDQIKSIVMEGIKKTNGSAQEQKAALLFPEISQLIRLIDTDLKGQRDRAMILLGFAGFLRRSELCGLKLEYINFVDSGLIITLPQAKTGANQEIAIEAGAFPVFCPVGNLKKWIDQSGITAGYLFPYIDKGGKMQNPEKPITTAGFVKMLKGYCKKIGINPDEIGGHSLRAGGATQASLNNASETGIKKHGRWKSDVYQEYIRIADRFKNNPSGKLGL